MKINLNDYIRVKLTKYGTLVHFNHYDSINRARGTEVIENCEPKVDENGYTTYVLWNFIHIFGDYIGLAKKNVIEPIDLEVVEKPFLVTHKGGDNG